MNRKNQAPINRSPAAAGLKLWSSCLSVEISSKSTILEYQRFSPSLWPPLPRNRAEATALFFKKVLTNQKSFVFLQHGKFLWFQALTLDIPLQWSWVFKETDGGNPYKECATFSIEVSFLLYPQFYVVLLFLPPNDRQTDTNQFQQYPTFSNSFLWRRSICFK